jgi:hypothetical protein
MFCECFFPFQNGFSRYRFKQNSLFDDVMNVKPNVGGKFLLTLDGAANMAWITRPNPENPRQFC